MSDKNRNDSFYFAFPAALLNHLSADWFILGLQPNDNFLSHVHHFSLKAWLHWERQLFGIIPLFVCLLSPHLPLSCFTPTFPFHCSRVTQNNPFFGIFLNLSFPCTIAHDAQSRVQLISHARMNPLLVRLSTTIAINHNLFSNALFCWNDAGGVKTDIIFQVWIQKSLSFCNKHYV